ncbi:MAG: hypothetical protein Q9191_004091 [Dirinaria sp. TL-2023a]
MPTSASDSTRADLTSRQIPHMTLSDGSPSSMTGPPPPAPHYLSSSGRALKRFAVEGNAILTGGTGTLALVTARALLEHGLSGLALLDLDPSSSAASGAEVDGLRREFPNAKILTLAVNVTDAVLVRDKVEEVGDALGSVDILICFAGVVGCQHATAMTPEEWRRTLDVNTTGAFLCAQAVARSRKQIALQLPCSIILIASISAQRVNYPQPQAAYNASKAALISLKSSLAAEWAVHGIRVNTISPGYMDTILNEGEGLEVARRTWCERNPMGRMGVPEELTGPVVMLCSQAGSYINAADIVVDGGQCCF